MTDEDRYDAAEANNRRIQIARDFGLSNVYPIATACFKNDLRFAVGCALAEKESMGKNVYGHDKGGALSGYPNDVTLDNYRVFAWLVFERGMTSNGVGPAQITYAGHFTVMEQRGLRPWVAVDNLTYGLEVLKGYKGPGKTWEDAGTEYNGSPTYGADLMVKINEWKARLA